MASKMTKNHSLLFSIPVLLAWCAILFFIGQGITTSFKENQQFWDLLIAVGGVIAYFSSALVKFYKLVQYSQEDNNNIESEKIVSPLEAVYYPVVLFLSTGLFGELIGLGDDKGFSFFIAIGASVIYLSIWIFMIGGDWFKKKKKA